MNVDDSVVKILHFMGSEQREGYLMGAHSCEMSAAVWPRYEYVCKKMAVLAVIEWDNHIPDFSVLMKEKEKANVISKRCRDESA